MKVSDFNGVSWYKNPGGLGGQWMAEVVVNGLRKVLGYSPDEEAAARIFDHDAAQLGQYVMLSVSMGVCACS